MSQTMTRNGLIELVRKSGLVDEEKLDKFLAELSNDGGEDTPTGHEELADKLIEAGLITGWHAGKLLEGKHRGFRLGKYKLLDHLGKGGMSTVYLAEHTLMQRRVAIKVLPHNRVEDPSYLKRFQQEARAAARLDDPNIVHAYDVDSEGKTHFLVMEYVDGKDLHQFVRDAGPLDYEIAADFILQAAKGLRHAHEEGLVHRDIKPANLLVDRKKTVKVLDMGLAKFEEPDEPSLTLAHEESVLGTADYLAPEQALNSHAADHRSDIYGLGCTLYFLLTGHPPFNEGSIRERLLKHQVETPPSIYKVRPDAPPGLVNICNRMMSKKPENRYQSASEVHDALKSWLDDRGYGSSGDSSGSLRRPDGLAGGSDFGIGRIGRSYPPSMQSGVDTLSDSKPDTSRLDEEEIGLAPLEDDEEKKRAKKPKDKPQESEAKSDSDVLGRKREDDAPQPSDITKDSGSTKSLLEEELQELEPITAPISNSGTSGTKAAGLSNPAKLAPYSKPEPASTHALLIWLIIGAGTILAIILLLALIAM